MSWNFKFFQRINALVGKNHWLDAFGRAGAEFVIFAMVGWYITADLVTFRPDWADVFRPLITLGVMALGGWLLNIWLGIIVKEPRPHVTHPESKLLFKPWMSWKSFPSDHAMLAWLVFFAALLFNLPFAWSLFFMALWVSWSRVFAGVHYPVDILGGATVAGIIVIIASHVLTWRF